MKSVAEEALWSAAGAVLFCVAVGTLIAMLTQLTHLKREVYGESSDYAYVEDIAYISDDAMRGEPVYLYEQVIGEFLTDRLPYSIQFANVVYTPSTWSMAKLQSLSVYDRDQRFLKKTYFDSNGEVYLVVYLPVKG